MPIVVWAFFLCDDYSYPFPSTAHIWYPIVTRATTISNFCIHAQQHTSDGRHQTLNINRAHLIESNELVNPTGIDGELLLAWAVSTYICQDAETVANSDVATYFTKNM